MKHILIVLIFTFFACNNNLSSQTLTSSSGTGTNSTTSSSMGNVGISATLNVTNINSVLVMSSFTCQLSENSATQRTASYQISDGSTSSGIIQRSLSVAKATDYGIGSVVSIFDVSSLSGSYTYNLQHSITSNKTLTTKGTIVAVCLTDKETTPNTIQSVSKEVSSAMAATSSWASVTGSESGKITTTSAGGFFIAASIQTSSPGGAGVCSWVLQYSTDNSSWSDLGSSVDRSVSSGSEKGISNLVAGLPSYTVAGDYYFRLAHKLTSGDMNTDAANIVVVALGFGSNKHYPNFADKKSTTSTNSTTTMEDMMKTVITPSTNTDLFFAAQYNMGSTTTITQPVFDLYIDDNSSYTSNGDDQYRYIAAGSIGSGVSVGLASSLISGTSYDVAARFASDGTNTLSANNIVLVGFALTSSTDGSTPLPIDLIKFDYTIINSEVNLSWQVATEENNNYFTIERSANGVIWTEIDRVQGAGNSNIITNYSIIDSKPLLGESYYRLKQTDFDGEYSFSNVIIVNNNSPSLNILPNPSNGKFQIETKEKIELTIFNTTGQEIYRNTLDASKICCIDLTSQPKGFYFLTYMSSNKKVVKKLVLR